MISNPTRHPHAWHPFYIWEILRFCPNYKKAVNKFENQAKKAHDSFALSLLNSRSVPVATGVRKKAGLAPARKNLFEKALMTADIPPMSMEELGQRFNISEEKIKKTEKSKYLQDFRNLYGDILSFPIRSERSSTLASGEIRSFWILRPASTMKLEYRHEKLTELNLSVNLNFSTQTIKDQAQKEILLLLKKLKKESGQLEELRPAWDAMQSYIDTFHAKVRLEAAGIRPTPKKLAEELGLKLDKEDRQKNIFKRQLNYTERIYTFLNER